jgi:hypothetical protein
MNETERRPKVTLEDLLQLKRAERPPVEFWTEFDRTLRAKQLAAIVETRPWWRTWTARKALVRVCMPLGASALLAISFSSVRVAGVKPQKNIAVNSEVAAQAPIVLRDSVATQEIPVPATTSQVVAMTEPEPQRNDFSGNLASVKMTQPTGIPGATSPEQLLTSGTATVKAAGQALAQLVGLEDFMGAPQANSRSTVVEPLTQVATPRDNRRTRLLAYSATFDPHAADSSAATRSRERVTHRLSDEAIYDSITRLGLSGDRVSIKF